MIRLILPVIALLHASTVRADLYDSDEELMRHLLSTDPILSRVSGECRDGRIDRSGNDGLARFTFTARCPAPPPEDDCPAYRVTAQGTVDTASLATIRDLRMELLCSDGAGATAQVGAGFRGAFDVVTALTLVYGRTPWNDALTTRFNTFENGRHFIEPLFDQAFVEGGVEKHIVIATLTPRPRSQYSCHGCSPMLGGAIFSRDGERWRLDAVGREIERGHAWFDATHGRLSLVRVGPERYGLLHLIDDVSGGYESRSASLMLAIDGELSSRFSARIPDSAGPGACPVPAVGLDVTIVDDERPGDSGLFDLVVDAAWNEAVCRDVEFDGGPGIRASGEACRRRARYRFEDGKYRIVATEVDVCTLIPERTVSLRG
jgi:hypothetical protein